MKENIVEEVVVPSGVTASVKGDVLLVKGSKVELSRDIKHPFVSVKVENGKIIVGCSRATKREKRIIGTFAAHAKNMCVGVQNPYVYKLKICGGHFPMNVALVGKELVIKNFLGEKSPRKVKIADGVVVKVAGDQITVESADLELAGRVASDIELATTVRNRDLRIFQDGIYITLKAE